MKKSYHSIVVPKVAATTARLSCLPCSASEITPVAVALAISRTSREIGADFALGHIYNGFLQLYVIKAVILRVQGCKPLDMMPSCNCPDRRVPCGGQKMQNGEIAGADVVSRVAAGPVPSRNSAHADLPVPPPSGLATEPVYYPS